MASAALSPPDWRIERRTDAARLLLTGDWIARETGLRDAATVDEVLAAAGAAGCLRVDAGGLGRWDSALVSFLQDLRAGLSARAAAGGARIELDDTGLPEPVRRLLALAGDGEKQAAAAPQPRSSLLALVGRRAIDRWGDLVGVSDLIGGLVLRIGGALRGRVSARLTDVMQLMREAGPGALGIVAVVNFMVGGILAFVGAVQLRRFGTEIYVADLVGIATVRELAPVMTAIVMAGRTGGAYAAHIAAMQGNEEIDALKVLGISVYDFLILPRVLALVVMMPLLYLYACVLGLIGGTVVSVWTLDLTPAAYFQETRYAVSGTQFVIGLVKSVAFGALIALAGCRIGLKAGRSASDVGRAATDAVVAGIIGVIALDAVFAVCADALGV